MSDKATLLVTMLSSTAVVGKSAYESAQSHASLLSSPLSEIMAGNFTLYGSDITTLAGLAVGTVGAAFGLLRAVKRRD